MKFEAVLRTDLGKGASRRLRNTGYFPAIVYGGEAAPVSISLNHDDVMNQMDKPEFYEAIVLVIDGPRSESEASRRSTPRVQAKS